METLDLNAPKVSLPSYKVKLKGETAEREFDVLVLGYRFRALEGVDDPEEILKVVKEAMELGEVVLTPFEACLILDDFKEFAKTEADEPLKKVFGRSLFSDTTTASAPQESES